MGRNKYYCDYCQKTFNDDPRARAQHLNGVRHLQLKEEHYKMFRTPEEVLKSETEKGPCKIYEREGYCRFGASCRFSHMSYEDLEILQRQVQSEREPALVIPNFNDWYENHCTRIKMAPVMSHAPQDPVEQLPISLRPFPVIDFLEAQISSWGE